MEPFRKFGRHILDAVDGKIDPLLEEGLLDLLHKEAFPADLGQWGILYLVPGRLDLDQSDGEVRMGSEQLVFLPSWPDRGQAGFPGFQSLIHLGSSDSGISFRFSSPNFSGSFSERPKRV